MRGDHLATMAITLSRRWHASFLWPLSSHVNLRVSKYFHIELARLLAQPTSVFSIAICLMAYTYYLVNYRYDLWFLDGGTRKNLLLL